MQTRVSIGRWQGIAFFAFIRNTIHICIQRDAVCHEVDSKDAHIEFPTNALRIEETSVQNKSTFVVHYGLHICA